MLFRSEVPGGTGEKATKSAPEAGPVRIGRTVLDARRQTLNIVVQGEPTKATEWSQPLGIRKRYIEEPVPEKALPNQPAPKKPEAAARKPKVEILHEGTVDVPTGGHTYLAFHLDKGTRVTGLLTEVDDWPFNFMVMDEENYAAYRNKENPDVEAEEVDISSLKVKFKVPRTDTWYFVFELYEKKKPREVQVELRAELPA